ncbi:FAD-dependent oxidoreductase [Bradyrhizobium manausense]|uniref:NAD(P)/FAD-dependent oxidoreductase n=1 Tax=Bradyrhizobium TaxID=374 RepID=UPI001BA7D404|nr:MULTISPECIES: FAD-dependent oxidoreductase [Bradyrhizobium]MBR0830013.1 FAD-dependent oxidoreductase [Bradyrhizobium manausense]UVO27747.1 FAD-dependent oxidoreductase [Bradyrhizobium arachidis]
MNRVVIVGAGQAGCSAALKLRALGFSGEIILIGDEPMAPYQRPPLSKAYLLGKTTAEALQIRPLSLYRDQRIELRLGCRVIRVLPHARRIETSTGSLDYDHLVLSIGARPLRLDPAIGGALGNVFTLRSIADVDLIRPVFSAGSRLLVIGGGYVGLEAAAVAAQSGLDVVLVEMADRILKRVACAETAAYFRALHAQHGVRILESTAVRRLDGNGTVARAHLSDDEVLATDLVIVGIGVKPDIALASEAGLKLGNGIEVDVFGRTSIEGIWAAGDCASFPYAGRRIRLESVPHAIDHAETVAANICGAHEPYVATPWFWSDQFDVKLQIAGLNANYDRVVVRRGGRPGAISHWYFGGDTLLAVDAMNDARSYMIAKRLIAAGITPDPKSVADAAIDPGLLLKAYAVSADRKRVSLAGEV